MGVLGEVWKQVRDSFTSDQCNAAEAHTMTAVMLMETFDRLTRKEKYVWDVSSAIVTLCAKANVRCADLWSR